MSSVLLYVMWLSPISVIPRLCCIHRLSSKLVNVQCVRVILYIYILPPMLYFHLYFSSCTVFSGIIPVTTMSVAQSYVKQSIRLLQDTSHLKIATCSETSLGCC